MRGGVTSLSFIISVAVALSCAPAFSIAQTPAAPVEGDAAPAAIPPPAPEASVANDYSASVDTAEVPPLEYPAPLPPPLPAPAPAAPKPPPQPWKTLFFDNDFSYKNSPNAPHYLGEELKLMPLDGVFPWASCDSTLSLGGEVRYRYMDESNRLRPGGPGRSTYDLWRWRQYADWRVNDHVRVYAEMLDASIYGQELPITGIDENRFDLQNGFVDWQFAEVLDRPVTARVGRQEILYGSQRLVSPLDWANTRRNFEGIKIFSPGTDWDIDLWVMNPVNTATTNDGPVDRFDHSFDTRNRDHTIGGAWFTNKSVLNETLDLFFLYDRNVQAVPAEFPLGERYLLGMRKFVNRPVDGTMATASRIWHWELEGGYQFGHDRGEAVNAGYGTAGLGYSWQDVKWTPNAWVFFDYASGDSSSSDSQNNRFYQYYGLAHAYLGLIDNIARQNIMDLNGRLTLKPTQKLQVVTGYHLFNLASTNDTLYSITGARVGAPNTGRSVGQEFDLVTTYTFNPNWSLEFGYFWFLEGAFIDNNTPRPDADQFYLMSTYRY